MGSASKKFYSSTCCFMASNPKGLTSSSGVVSAFLQQLRPLNSSSGHPKAVRAFLLVLRPSEAFSDASTGFLPIGILAPLFLFSFPPYPPTGFPAFFLLLFKRFSGAPSRIELALRPVFLSQVFFFPNISSTTYQRPWIPNRYKLYNTI